MPPKTVTRPTLKDVAQHAKVSVVSAGRVLLGSGAGSVRVGEQTAARIRAAAEQVGYQPNLVARQLAGKKSHTIGVIIDSQAPEVHRAWVTDIEQRAYAKGYRLLIGQSHDDPARLIDYVNDFAGRGIDGLVCVAHTYPQHGGEIAEAVARLARVVFIGKPLVDGDAYSYVETDVADGVQQIVDHLADRGRQRLGLLLFSSGHPAMTARMAGYRAGLQQRALPFNEELICYLGLPEDVEITSMRQHILRLVQCDKADALIASNDSVAATAIRILKEEGYKVPEDVAVTGYDNLSWTDLFRPRITSVDQRSEAVSDAAMKILMSMISSKEGAWEVQRELVKPELVVRDSS